MAGMILSARATGALLDIAFEVVAEAGEELKKLAEAQSRGERRDAMLSSAKVNMGDAVNLYALAVAEDDADCAIRAYSKAMRSLDYTVGTFGHPQCRARREIAALFVRFPDEAEKIAGLLKKIPFRGHLPEQVEMDGAVSWAENIPDRGLLKAMAEIASIAGGGNVRH